MNWAILICTLLWCQYVNANITSMIEDKTMEEHRIDMLMKIIIFNVKENGWNNIIFVGDLPDRTYDLMKHLHPLAFTVIDPEKDNTDFEDIVKYPAKIIIISCRDFDDLENCLGIATISPYWNPHAQFVLLYHTMDTTEIARTFFTFWYYMIIYAVILQYDDSKQLLFVSYYNPYMTENFQFQNMYGCWKIKKVGLLATGYKDSFACEDGCSNITLHSKLRSEHLGTCIGYETHAVRYGDFSALKHLKIFEDFSRDYHGYVMRAHGIPVPPFLEIKEENDGSYTLTSRDGEIWSTMAKIMNFKINLDSCRHLLKQPFNLNININLVFTFAHRQADVLLIPLYLFDLVIVEVDFSTAFKESGVCIISHRAGFETVLFDVKLLHKNSAVIVQFVLCFVSIWLLFYIYNASEGKHGVDQIGKDFLNSIRHTLSISLYRPPRRQSFRIFLAVSIWSFFILNFGIQAAIVSFFSVYKRGKEVDTFEDILEKKYPIEGLVSPDMMLPDTEELFVKVNARVKPLLELFECVDKMSNDSERFCLIDCSVGRYLERNRLSDKGTQYLHIARKNRMHNNYLNMIHHKNSPMTQRFNKYIRRFVESGLIKKWEQYRFTEFKDEFPLKALNMDDLQGIFQCFYLILGISSVIFVIEVIIGYFRRGRKWFVKKTSQWRQQRLDKKKLRHEKYLKVYPLIQKMK